MTNKVPASVANPKRSDKIPAWIAFHRCLSGNMEKRIFHMKRQSGFTLIELMIVVAIVAILAAIALPAYQTYTKKAKFTEVISASAPFKTAIEVCYQSTNDITKCQTQAQNGIPAVASAAGGLVSSVVIAAGTNSATQSKITVTGTGVVDGKNYILEGSVSNSRLTWEALSSATCTAAGLC